MVASKKIALGHNENNYGHSLLSFMKLASNKVKAAMEKPNSFKRNINHRRFLQKQFKALVKSPDKVTSRKHLAKERIPRREMDYRQPCGENQFPPLNATSSLQFAPLQPYYPTLDIQESFTNPFGTSKSSYERSSCERSSCKLRQCERGPETSYRSIIPEVVMEDESFLTGEELTEAIELKDLFIPETDLTQYLNIRDSLEILASNKTNPDFDSWICHEFTQYKR